MEFDLNNTLQILERTPQVLKDLLSGLSDDWVLQNEGGDTWSPYDIVGHLIHGEHTNWMCRLEIIMQEGGNKTFIPFTRSTQFTASEGKSLKQLLDEFESIRKRNLKKLKELSLTGSDLSRTGIHPEFGEVTMAQLLSTWTVHDLTHLSQIIRVMAKQYKTSIGPWVNYIRLLSL